MPALRSFLITGWLCFLVSCSSETEKLRSIGEAYVGPGTLEMREDVSLRSKVTATVKHGERLDVLATRRNFVRVRNGGGTSGWVNAKNLLSTQQMKDLAATINDALRLPSQGRAIVYDVLNMHTEPNRQSPSPFQIPPNGSVEVVAHLLTPRLPYQAVIPSIVTQQKAVPKKPKKKPKKGKGKEEQREEKSDVPPPPMPQPPKPPENWQELSKTDLDDDKPQRKQDDWTLVRTADKKAGWVLTRMLAMAVPDDVLQYAEGKRIMAYFPLGEVQDEDKKKNHWVWATLAHPMQSYDYDGIRVFIYNVKRHRYETAFRDNTVRGFYPILTMPVEVVENKKTLTAPGFSTITEDDEGQRWQRTYAFLGYRVRLVKKEPVAKPVEKAPTNGVPTAAPLTPEKRGWLDRLKALFSK
ncbi:MAG: SH3 domain-containing protein [Acidobacteria bacterium]|nr:SH3 domain-containing protein [Acidobacteriota bacterium]